MTAVAAASGWPARTAKSAPGTRRRLAAYAAALGLGALVALGAWHPDGSVALVALLPLLWTLQRSRIAAGLVWIGYFLAGSHEMPAVFAKFFPDEPWAFGLVLWLVDAFVLAIPWMLFWVKDCVRPTAVFLRTVIAIVVFTVPPIGFLGWLSPLLAGGVLFPGLGWFGIGGTIGLLGVLAVGGHALRSARSTALRAAVLLTAGIIAAAAVANITFRPPAAPAGWVAIDTQLGRFPTEPYAAFQHQQELIRLATEAIEGGAKVIVLPEEVAGVWRPAVAYWWKATHDFAARHGATVLVGADVPVTSEAVNESAAQFTNSLVMLGATEGRVNARVPVPVGLWRPWSERGAVADIAGSGIVELHRTHAAISICYEELLAWPTLVSFAQTSQPRVLIHVANNWFYDGLGSLWIQRRSGELWERLFGVQAVRATNTKS